MILASEYQAGGGTVFSDTPSIVYLHPAKQQVGFPFTDPRFSYLTPFLLMPVGIVGLANLLRKRGFPLQGLNYPAESFIQPGFNNKQVLEISNMSNMPLALYPGTKICQIVFERCEGKSTYKGRYSKQDSI